MATGNSNGLNVSREARQLYLLLWTVADDAGRIHGEPRDLAGVLYPNDDAAQMHIGSWLDELETERRIRPHGTLFAIADWRIGE